MIGLELRWRLKSLCIQRYSGAGKLCNYEAIRKRSICMDTGSKLNNEKWWRRYGIHTGSPFKSWRSGRWLGIQWDFRNEYKNRGELK